MATTHDSTTIRGVPSQGRDVIRDLALYDKPGVYRSTPHQSNITRANLTADNRSEQHTMLLDALEMLDRMSGKAPMFRDARTRVLGGVGVAVVDDGAAYQIDGLRVQPDPARFGWPWRCQCKEPRCWHAALCEALVVVQSEADGAAVTVIVVREV